MANDFTLMLGRVVEPTDPKVPDCKVVLLGYTFYLTGEILLEDKKTIEIDNGDTTETLEIDNTSTITCKWISLGNPNRVSSPALYGGETVLVLYHQPSNRYFYTAFFTDIDLKKTDVIEYYFSARSKDSEENEDERSGSYRLVIDTENKQVTFNTSDLNEEKTTFKFLLDLLKGQFLLANGEGDFFNMVLADEEDPDNKPSKMHKNLEGELVTKATLDSYTELGKDDVKLVGGDSHTEITGSTFIKVKKDCNMAVDGVIAIEGKGDLNLDLSGKGNLKIKGDAILQSEGKIGITSLQGEVNIFGGSTITMCTPTFNIIAPAVSVSGALQAASLSVGGGSSSSPAPMVIQGSPVDWEPYTEAFKKLKEKTKIESDDGGDSSDEDSNNEESKEEEKKEEDKKPAEVNGESKSKDAIVDVEGKVEFKSGTTASIEAQSSMSLVGGSAKLEGKQGVSVTGAGVSLFDLIKDICTVLTKMDTALTTPTVVTGTSVSGGTVTGAGTISYSAQATDIAKIVTNNTKMKGSARMADISSLNISDEELLELSSMVKRLK